MASNSIRRSVQQQAVRPAARAAVSSPNREGGNGIGELEGLPRNQITIDEAWRQAVESFGRENLTYWKLQAYGNQSS